MKTVYQVVKEHKEREFVYEMMDKTNKESAMAYRQIATELLKMANLIESNVEIK